MQHQFPGIDASEGELGGPLWPPSARPGRCQSADRFPDAKVSGRRWATAMGNLTQQLRAGANPTNVPAQPWFENLLPANLGVRNGYPNTTSLVADNLGSIIAIGDFADTIQALSSGFGLPYNVGMASQFANNTSFTSKGFSSYNGLAGFAAEEHYPRADLRRQLHLGAFSR